jgi:hypothetical protein
MAQSRQDDAKQKIEKVSARSKSEVSKMITLLLMYYLAIGATLWAFGVASQILRLDLDPIGDVVLQSIVAIVAWPWLLLVWAVCAWGRVG